MSTGHQTQIHPYDNAHDVRNITHGFDSSVDLPIQGHGFIAVREFAYPDVIGLSEDQLKEMVKEDLVHRLIEKAHELKLIEYTKSHDYSTDKITIRARCYLLPDDKVRLFRVNKLIK